MGNLPSYGTVLLERDRSLTWLTLNRLERLKIPSRILRGKKLAINRASDIVGFRTIAPLGAETDALRRCSNSVTELTDDIREYGLKGAMARFNQGGASAQTGATP